MRSEPVPPHVPQFNHNRIFPQMSANLINSWRHSKSYSENSFQVKLLMSLYKKFLGGKRGLHHQGARLRRLVRRKQLQFPPFFEGGGGVFWLFPFRIKSTWSPPVVCLTSNNLLSLLSGEIMKSRTWEGSCCWEPETTMCELRNLFNECTNFLFFLHHREILGFYKCFFCYWFYWTKTREW